MLSSLASSPACNAHIFNLDFLEIDLFSFHMEDKFILSPD